jgi:hypothetical protein
LSVAIDTGNALGPINPATGIATNLASVEPTNPATLGPTSPAAAGPTDLAAPTPPAMMALPANVGPLATDAGTNRKFYTLTASLREVYDDNVGTSSSGSHASLETELSPSILVDFPMENSEFSARYTFDITYYSNRDNTQSNNGGSNGSSGTNGGSITFTHEFVAQYTHAFSDRFNLALSEQFRYFTEPSLFQSTGTNYQDGPYIANTLNGMVSAQWTPLFGTTTTYANTVVRYDDAAIAVAQNSIENTGSQSFSFAILPKLSLNFGGIGDNITYTSGLRGYTNYTGFIGAGWKALPSLSLSGRGGISYIEPIGSKASIGPYAALSLTWTLGARSSLSFDYAHEVTPTDQVGANGQTSDRFSASFNYDITPSLSAHLQGIFTNAVISQSLITPTSASTSGTVSSTNEYDYELDTGLTYQYDRYLAFDLGIILSGVTSNNNSSGNSGNDYTRDEAYVGVRGTY